MSAPAAIAAMLAPLVVGTQTQNQVWQWSLLVMVGLLGWAVLRTPTRRVVALAVLVVGFWSAAFGATAFENRNPSTRVAPPPGANMAPTPSGPPR